MLRAYAMLGFLVGTYGDGKSTRRRERAARLLAGYLRAAERRGERRKKP